MEQQLSIVINVKNGEKTIARCLSSLRMFTDIIVFDNYSTDKTIEIAKQYPNVTIIQHEFCGMGKVRNLAAAHAKNDWVLFIDCDESINTDLAQVLLSTNFEQGNIYLIKRHNYFANLFINSSSWENDWIKRLYNRTDTRFVQNEVHDSFEINSHIKYKKINSGFIYHFPYATVSELINKMQFYSTLYAKQHYTKKHPYLWLIPFRAFFMFFKCYILKRGFMDGFAGFAISSYNAMGVFSKYIKLYELYNNKVLGVAFKVSKPEELYALSTFINRQNLLPQYIYILVTAELFGKEYDKLLKYSNELCMQNKIIPLSDNESRRLLREFQERNHESVIPNWLSINTENLDYIIYLEDNQLLTDADFLKKCKQKIIKNKHLTKVKLIDCLSGNGGNP
jgi:glycosyltransferase involved in cell wall biosynthesis